MNSYICVTEARTTNFVAQTVGVVTVQHSMHLTNAAIRSGNTCSSFFLVGRNTDVQFLPVYG